MVEAFAKLPTQSAILDGERRTGVD